MWAIGVDYSPSANTLVISVFRSGIHAMCNHVTREIHLRYEQSYAGRIVATCETNRPRKRFDVHSLLGEGNDPVTRC